MILNFSVIACLLLPVVLILHAAVRNRKVQNGLLLAVKSRICVVLPLVVVLLVSVVMLSAPAVSATSDDIISTDVEMSDTVTAADEAAQTMAADETPDIVL